ncbi:hypothetical protein PCANC_15619 [Puccinia coronata f. sp. avenae]|uniref:Mitochondrial fission 1 protein n=1 Tax=Puccinia coronata f. sp. avenae TaxID=200324 RepID=A0A2N5SF64_9BASI|nr:hypothetical protein PCANC_15619 [Puccinia coronata f. sp. avenae]
MVTSASTLTDKLPYAADISLGLSPEELAVLREQYQNEQAKGWISTQTKFNLAWGLVKGNVRQGQVSEGIAILMDVYRTDSNRRRECLYYLSLGHYKLGNYTEAKRFNDLLLEKEPRNLQAKSLAQLIEKAVTQEGYLGLSIAGGAALVGGVLLAINIHGMQMLFNIPHDSAHRAPCNFCTWISFLPHKYKCAPTSGSQWKTGHQYHVLSASVFSNKKCYLLFFLGSSVCMSLSHQKTMQVENPS